MKADALTKAGLPASAAAHHDALMSNANVFAGLIGLLQYLKTHMPSIICPNRRSFLLAAGRWAHQDAAAGVRASGAPGAGARRAGQRAVRVRRRGPRGCWCVPTSDGGSCVVIMISRCLFVRANLALRLAALQVVFYTPTASALTPEKAAHITEVAAGSISVEEVV